jgi:putative membrane protein
MLALTLAVVHLVSLVFGVSVLMLRARALAVAETPEDVKRVLSWDNLAGLVASFWIGSGLWRAFGGLEKGTDYYLSNHAFWGKMLLLAMLLGLESIAVVTFVRWRIRLGRGQQVSLTKKASLVRLHWAEFWLMVGMVVMASLMARGVGVVRAKTAPAVPLVSLDLGAGEEAYRAYCLGCHQADGRGFRGKVAADFVADPSRLAKSDDVLFRSIAEGVPNTAMRGFAAELSPEQIRNVLGYIRARFGAKAH